LGTALSGEPGSGVAFGGLISGLALLRKLSGQRLGMVYALFSTRRLGRSHWLYLAGATYLMIKTEGEIQRKVWLNPM